VYLGTGTLALAQITLTGTIRDFNDTHPDFEALIAVDPGIVLFNLGLDKKPVYAGQSGNPTTHGQTAFDQWYRDTPGINMGAPLSITLTEIGSTGIFQYINNSFFPIDNQLFGNQGRPHNFHFTYEVHTTFTYMGGETFTFTGDDDLWVFLNDRLAIDLGGVHGALSATVDLDASAGTLGLVTGNTYDFDLFFAERHTSQSNFRIETTIALAPVGPTLDIKPGSCPNPFNTKLYAWSRESNPNKGGVLPVAIMGSDAFDVSEIDISTILLEGVAPLTQGGGPIIGDVGARFERPKDECDCTEDGPDGSDDLSMKFRAQEIAAAIGPGVHKEDRMLTLTFQTFDGTQYEIQDCIRFVGGPSDPNPFKEGVSVLKSAYPNPFNPVTRISYVLPEDAHVVLAVYDVQGRLVERLVSGVISAGEHIVEWDAKQSPSGIYFFRLEVGDYAENRKVILLK
jgi:fibro-slime domain-containing protein